MPTTLHPNDKLRAYWSKQKQDMMFYYPMGQQTVCDASYLNSIFTKEFTLELERRGYDHRTIRFSVSPMKGNQRFASQRVNETPKA